MYLPRQDWLGCWEVQIQINAFYEASSRHNNTFPRPLPNKCTGTTSTLGLRLSTACPVCCQQAVGCNVSGIPVITMVMQCRPTACNCRWGQMSSPLSYPTLSSHSVPIMVGPYSSCLLASAAAFPCLFWQILDGLQWRQICPFWDQGLKQKVNAWCYYATLTQIHVFGAIEKLAYRVCSGTGGKCEAMLGGTVREAI